jgi:sigma-B regulation protein RsbU (phosphoserine phosphatase)
MSRTENSNSRIALRLRKLIEANQSLAQVESVANLVPLFLNLAREVTDAEASSFLIYDPHRRVLRFSAITDESISDGTLKNIKESIELQLGQGIAGWVAQQRQPLIVADAQKDRRFFNRVDRSTGFVTRSILCVPVLYGEELLGVIEVLNARGKASFDDSDRDLLVSFADLAAVAIIRARLLEERLQQQKVNIEMETAAKIQALFRPEVPDIGSGSRFWAVSIPARYVGGDLYDIIPMPDGSWLIYVADVSDKGLPAAMIMAALWYRIRSEAHLHPDVGRLLEALNTALYRLLEKEGYFVTLIIGQYRPAGGTIELACGGHLPALKVSPHRAVPLTGKRGASLGIACCQRYDIDVHHLSPGESILFVTDGVSEANNPEGELFGHNRMLQTVQATAGPPWGQHLLSAVEAWQSNAEPSDDLTLLEIWRERA